MQRAAAFLFGFGTGRGSALLAEVFVEVACRKHEQ